MPLGQWHCACHPDTYSSPYTHTLQNRNAVFYCSHYCLAAILPRNDFFHKLYYMYYRLNNNKSNQWHTIYFIVTLFCIDGKFIILQFYANVKHTPRVYRNKISLPTRSWQIPDIPISHPRITCHCFICIDNLVFILILDWIYVSLFTIFRGSLYKCRSHVLVPTLTGGHVLYWDFERHNTVYFIICWTFLLPI